MIVSVFDWILFLIILRWTILPLFSSFFGKVNEQIDFRRFLCSSFFYFSLLWLAFCWQSCLICMCTGALINSPFNDWSITVLITQYVFINMIIVWKECNRSSFVLTILPFHSNLRFWFDINQLLVKNYTL